MLKLQRATRSNEGTFGILSKDDKPLCITLEDPWNDNKRNISCIPEGTYHCTPHFGEKYKDVWILNDVPNRSGILIHAGNTIDNTEGCILPGLELGYMNGKLAVLKSRSAMSVLKSSLPESFELKISDPS